jgi:tetratricopeptide (TPR) repeat protein
MYKIRICLLFLFVCYKPLFSQKLLNKIADKTCDCINQRGKHYDGPQSELYQGCISLTVNNFRKELEKEYGKEFFSSDNAQAKRIGTEIGAILISRCQTVKEALFYQVNAGQDSLKDMKKQAWAKLDQGKYDEAIKLFSWVIAKHSNDFDSYNSRGYCYYYSGDYYRAISNYLQAIDFNPSFARAYANMALAKISLNDYTDALRDVNAAVTYDSSLAVAHNTRGLIYFHNEQYDSAYLAFSKAFSLDTASGLYAYNCGISLSNADQYEKAAYYFNKALAVNYINASVFNYLGVAYFHLEKYNDAVNCFSKSIAADTTVAVYFGNRASAYEQLGEFTKALVDYNIAIKKDDSDCTYYKGRGNVLKNFSRGEEACRDIKKAEELGCEGLEEMKKETCK